MKMQPYSPETRSRKMHLPIISNKHLLTASIILLSLIWQTGSIPAHNEVMVMEGREADIPCVTMPSSLPLTSNLQEESVPKTARPTLIVWYKDGVTSSIYTYDGRNPDNERHWSIRRSMGGALGLTLPASPDARPQLAFLSIGYTHPTDAGVYHCRVDFKNAPGRKTYTKLIVVAPPTAPSVEVWAGGRWLHTTHETSTATVEVGTKLSLRCSTTGGKPLPTVTWWRGGQQLLGEDTTEEDLVSSSVNITVVPEDAHKPIVCQASNTHLIPPLRTPLLLLVLSPPKWLRVVGGDRPMSAGMTYTVECRCVGARPPPVITWSVGGDELYHATSTTDSDGETISRLRFTPKAAHFGTHITCTARPPEHAQTAASPHSTPTLWVKSDSIPLKILYKPEVHLNLQLIKVNDLSGTTKERKTNNKNNGETTLRPAPFSPSTAIKHNPFFKSREAINKEGESQDNQMDVDLKSDTQITQKNEKKGTNSMEEAGEEGVVSVEEFAGVVLQCNIRANPPAYHVSWHRDGLPLSPIKSPGLLVGNMSAIFPSLKRTDAGNLTCTAHNSEGSTRSKPIQLHVKHGPECIRKTAKVIGVPRHHALNVTCEIESDPLPTDFSWALRSSKGILAIPPEMITFSGPTSWITYTPRANIDFGDLLCWAHTPSGRQEEPCVAQLVSAEKPDTPEDCKVTQRTSSKLTVSCKAAHDGGLPQTFFMRVFHAGLQVTNSTSVTPELTVYELEPDTRFRLTLWSANTHGTSTGHTTLYTSTLPSNTSSTTSSMNGHSSDNPRGLLTKFGSSILAVVVVVTVVGVVIGIVVGIMVQKIDKRTDPSQQPEGEDEGEEHPPTLINNNHVNVAMAGIGEFHRETGPQVPRAIREVYNTL